MQAIQPCATSAKELSVDNEQSILSLTGSIVAAYVQFNTVPAAELPGIISAVHAKLADIAGGKVDAKTETRVPFCDPRKSVTRDYIICLEDGKQFKSLKRYLATTHHITPEQYRTRWGLPSDYPMVAPSYSERRSALAKKLGLGRVRQDKEAGKTPDKDFKKAA
jgi:predicted transcriptional regulator